MRRWKAINATVAAAVMATAIAGSAAQAPAVLSVDENFLREYVGTYQWDLDSFMYLQLWSELTGKNQLIAFDESGEVRALYPTDRDRFFTGPGAATPSSIESRVDFQRDDTGRITSLSWRRDDRVPRIAR